MGTNDYSAEAAENYEQKCLCVLVLDISASMIGQSIDELNKGLQKFYDEIDKDETTRQRLEISLMTFNHKVTTVQEPALVDNFTMPTLIPSGGTAICTAVNKAIDKVEARKKWYKQTNQAYYRPWIILMTDGIPNFNQNIDQLACRIDADVKAKKYAFLPIGVEGADMKVLKQIASGLPARKLRATKFSSFFKWLSASMSTVVNTGDEKQIDFSEKNDDWMVAFTI